jgi:hypothetical protein
MVSLLAKGGVDKKIPIYTTGRPQMHDIFEGLRAHREHQPRAVPAARDRPSRLKPGNWPARAKSGIVQQSVGPQNSW